MSVFPTGTATHFHPRRPTQVSRRIPAAGARAGRCRRLLAIRGRKRRRRLGQGRRLARRGAGVAGSSFCSGGGGSSGIGCFSTVLISTVTGDALVWAGGESRTRSGPAWHARPAPPSHPRGSHEHATRGAPRRWPRLLSPRRRSCGRHGASGQRGHGRTRLVAASTLMANLRTPRA